MLAVGLMSGTSLDGVDAVLCDIQGVDTQTTVKQIAFDTYPLPENLREKIALCCENKSVTAGHICSLNFEIGLLFAQAVKNICQKGNVCTKDLAFVASHGQTLYHIPKDTSEYVASTLQIGEPAIIAQQCGCLVISNFRTKDMAWSGEGAPLVPFSEYILYRDQYHSVGLQNIGGIGNVTIIPANAGLDDIYAFDTGPGNMMIDYAMQVLYKKPFDNHGKIAQKGKLIPTLQKELIKHPYMSQKPPKSTGREMFGVPYTDYLLKKYSMYSMEDLVATLTWFTSWSIAESYRKFVLPKDSLYEVILGGGGAHNLAIQNFLKQELDSIHIVTQEEKGFSSDAKEAIAFVILGNQTLHRKPSNVPSATGAKQSAILGQITYPDLI